MLQHIYFILYLLLRRSAVLRLLKTNAIALCINLRLFSEQSVTEVDRFILSTVRGILTATSVTGKGRTDITYLKFYTVLIFYFSLSKK